MEKYKKIQDGFFYWYEQHLYHKLIIIFSFFLLTFLCNYFFFLKPCWIDKKNIEQDQLMIEHLLSRFSLNDMQKIKDSFTVNKVTFSLPLFHSMSSLFATPPSWRSFLGSFICYRFSFPFLAYLSPWQYRYDNRINFFFTILII